MTGWKKDTGEGSIYRIKRVRANLTYSLRRIREIRGCSGGYGNYSHGNQGIAQVI